MVTARSAKRTPFLRKCQSCPSLPFSMFSPSCTFSLPREHTHTHGLSSSLSLSLQASNTLLMRQRQNTTH
ncbi:hypothetical protein BDP27DRAFT_1337073, partial [Rhodocollybia butyracea]